MAIITCPECKHEVSSLAVSCPHCGFPIAEHLSKATPEDEAVSPLPADQEDKTSTASTEEPASPASEPQKSQKGPLVAICLVAIIGICFALFTTVIHSPKHNFNNLDKKYTTTGCTISKDGKTMVLDTNPTDTENGDLKIVYTAIAEVNKKLGFSDAVLQKMSATRAIDGLLEETSGNITVSWMYHPDRGLEAIYSIK